MSSLQLALPLLSLRERRAHTCADCGYTAIARQLKSLFADTVRRFCRLHCDAVASEDLPQIVLTRERGKNGKLAKALQKKHLDVLEVPLVETALGPDRYILQ